MKNPKNMNDRVVGGIVDNVLTKVGVMRLGEMHSITLSSTYWFNVVVADSSSLQVVTYKQEREE